MSPAPGGRLLVSSSVVKILNEALATEIVCVLRYRRHHFMAAEYVEGETLLDMIREDLVAERIAIDSYREMKA